MISAIKQLVDYATNPESSTAATRALEAKYGRDASRNAALTLVDLIEGGIIAFPYKVPDQPWVPAAKEMIQLPGLVGLLKIDDVVDFDPQVSESERKDVQDFVRSVYKREIID